MAIQTSILQTNTTLFTENYLVNDFIEHFDVNKNADE